MDKRSPAALISDNFVRVRGAREHNLKNVSVDIPRNATVVFSGVSGSGKSSLAFGTLYAEAQRRYMESVAPYARRLIDQAGIPDVDSIEGLPPAIALQQQRGAPSVRSSIGSVTTLSSLLRLLYSRAGTYPPGQPMLYAEDFSPNTPEGACSKCHGLGRVYAVTEKTLVPDDRLTIRERAIAAWPPAWHGQNLRDILVSMGYDVDKPWRDLPKKQRDWILFTEEQPTVPVYAGYTPAETRVALKKKEEPSYMGTFTSAERYVLHTFATTQSALMKRRVSRYMIGQACTQCHGKRLKRESLSVTFGGLDIAELSSLPLGRLMEVLMPAAKGQFAHKSDTSTLSRAKAKRDIKRRIDEGGSSHAGAPDVRRTGNLSEEKRIAAQRLAENMVVRLSTLNELGLGYVSLDRTTTTLSPGELQRTRLATQIRSNLFGVIYVLDEPTAGLHPADSETLLRSLDQLKRSGNSLFIVEHDIEVMRKADWLVDVGPGAGELGGRVLYSGPPKGLAAVNESRTRPYLLGSVQTKQREPRVPAQWLELKGITRNNLINLDVRFPLGLMTVVTGVSGSGKSSLVSQALVELICGHLGHGLPDSDDEELEDADGHVVGGHVGSGIDRVKRLVRVDQKPIGRTPRSNLATYTGLFDNVRKLFADTKAARARRYGAGRFSFNIGGGRCETCEGEGFVSVELLFMPSVYAPCPVCHGSRYNEKTLEVAWKDKNIAEVLSMNVTEAKAFFEEIAVIRTPLALLQNIGLGYLRLGQPATELSGGEAQRIKLVTELQRPQKGNTLYVLDEPTTGLHPADVDLLMSQLQELVNVGNTVIMAEHNTSVIRASDWVIDMGPGAGDKGGQIVAEGTPWQVSRNKLSVIGPFIQ